MGEGWFTQCHNMLTLGVGNGEGHKKVNNQIVCSAIWIMITIIIRRIHLSQACAYNVLDIALCASYELNFYTLHNTPKWQLPSMPSFYKWGNWFREQLLKVTQLSFNQANWGLEPKTLHFESQTVRCKLELFEATKFAIVKSAIENEYNYTSPTPIQTTNTILCINNF